jgi:hypothetical protein
MPYNVIKRGSKFVVQKQDGTRTFGTHDTKEEADRQLAALYATEPKVAESRALHLLGAIGKVRTDMVGKLEHLIVPVVALIEGVIHAVNSDYPELVPVKTLQQMAKTFNDKPITLGHPKKDGKQCSASDAAALGSHIGFIRNARVEGKKLLMEALIDTSKAKKLDPNMYARLEQGGTEEVSVGALVVTDKQPGEWLGPQEIKKPYKATWVAGEGDHLAFLNTRGACSVSMGCGTHRAAMRVCADHLEDDVDSIIDPATLKCLRDIPQSARDKMNASDFAGPNESFPISTQADVDAAAHLIGKAADPEAVKRKIIAIAKRKGLTVPAAWQSMKAAAATPDAEEQAELIAYQSMRSAWDAADSQWDQISTLIDALISDETDDPTETPEEEDAEEQVESARIDSIRMLCIAMMGVLSGLSGMTYGSALRDDDYTRMMEMKAAEGARHSKQDASVIQQMHDHTMALGAACDRGNMKMAEQHLVSIDDPNLVYIHRVKKTAVK